MRLAIALPRYGTRVVGGAERHGRELSHKLAAAGHNVHICTSTLAHLDDQMPSFAPGVQNDGPVTIHRFPTRPPAPGIDGLNRILATGGRLGPSEERQWLLARGDTPDLTDHLAAGNYDAVLALPYLAATTWRAVYSDTRTVLIPCLHNEPMARFTEVAALFARAHAIMYNTPAEASLGATLCGTHKQQGYGGMGFPSCLPAETDSPGADFESVDIDVPNRPYLLYIGRWEGGKGVPELELFANRLWQEGKRVTTVFIGGGPEMPTRTEAVLPLGFVSEAAKHDLVSHALAVCQPSRNESLSIVLMEAWLARCAALVSSWCAVTRDHIIRSGGGFHYAGYKGFATSVTALMDRPSLRSSLGRAGHHYVEAEWSWPIVIDRIQAHLERWLT